MGAAFETGLSIRWGKTGSKGTVKHIAARLCQNNNPVLELKSRALHKLYKGYELMPHETQLP